MAQKPVLGKGLASLFPSNHTPNPAIFGAPAPDTVPPVDPSQSPTKVSAQAPETPNRDRHPGISMALIQDIQVNHYQPRRDFDDASLQDLARSIQVSGIIQPLIVRKGGKSGFELIAGERRLRAAKLAGLKQVPIVIRRSTDRETLELALVENIQRQDLNCVDEALAYFQLIQDFSLTQEEVADRVGKDRATVSNYLRLLRLPEKVILDLRRETLSFGHGKALLGLETPELRLQARDRIVESKLSVRDTEALVDAMKREAEVDKKPNADQPDSKANPVKSRLLNLSSELARFWSAKVEIKGNDQRGKIVIHYATPQDLDRILEGMQTEGK